MLSRKIAELAEQVDHRASTGDRVAQNLPKAPGTEIRPLYQETAAARHAHELVGGALAGNAGSTSHQADAPVDRCHEHLHDPRERSVLEEDEHKERRSADRFRTGAVLSPVVGLGCAAAVLLSQPRCPCRNRSSLSRS